MANFYTSVIQLDSRFLSANRVQDADLLEPNFRSLVDAVVADAAALGIPLMIFETYRSQARQSQLFQQQATRLKRVGVHHYGLAVDLVKLIDGAPSWKGDFAFLGRIAARHGLIWGGNWGNPHKKPSFYDGVHLQRIRVADQKRLFSGTWYPSTDYHI